MSIGDKKKNKTLNRLRNVTTLQELSDLESVSRELGLGRNWIGTKRGLTRKLGNKYNYYQQSDKTFLPTKQNINLYQKIKSSGLLGVHNPQEFSNYIAGLNKNEQDTAADIFSSPKNAEKTLNNRITNLDKNKQNTAANISSNTKSAEQTLKKDIKNLLKNNKETIENEKTKRKAEEILKSVEKEKSKSASQSKSFASSFRALSRNLLKYGEAYFFASRTGHEGDFISSGVKGALSPFTSSDKTLAEEKSSAMRGGEYLLGGGMSPLEIKFGINPLWSAQKKSKHIASLPIDEREKIYLASQLGILENYKAETSSTGEKIAGAAMKIGDKALEVAGAVAGGVIGGKMVRGRKTKGIAKGAKGSGSKGLATKGAAGSVAKKGLGVAGKIGGAVIAPAVSLAANYDDYKKGEIGGKQYAGKAVGAAAGGIIGAAVGGPLAPVTAYVGSVVGEKAGGYIGKFLDDKNKDKSLMAEGSNDKITGLQESTINIAVDEQYFANAVLKVIESNGGWKVYQQHTNRNMMSNSF